VWQRDDNSDKRAYGGKKRKTQTVSRRVEHGEAAPSGQNERIRACASPKEYKDRRELHGEDRITRMSHKHGM